MGRNASRESKAALQKKLDAAAQKLLQAKQNVAKLQVEYCRVREELNALESAIMSLPAEILLEIFLLLCEGRRMDDVKLLCSERPPQFVIGAVCRAWRHIAWGASRIWRTITITFLSTRITSQTQLLQEWLKRSGTSLLDIYLDTECLDEDEEEHEYDKRFYQPPRKTFEIICTVSHRWRKLHTPRFIPLDDLLQSESVSSPSLQELYLSDPDAEYYYDDMETIDWDLRESLHLKKLNLNMLSIRGLKMNWGTITHLEIRMNPLDYLHHLEDCTALESLTLFMGDPTYREVPLSNESDVFITLSRLTRLSIHEQPMTIESIVSYLITPKLKSLSLSPYRERVAPTEWTLSVAQFIHRSSCSLTQIDVTNAPAVLRIRELAFYLKTVTRFSVLDPPFADQKISDAMLLVFDLSERKDFFPELEELTLEGTFTCNIETLLRMIKSRVSPPLPNDDQPPVKRIQKIDIVYNNAEFTQHVEPNALQRFYDELRSLSKSTGPSIKISFQKKFI
ncbi:hypothetical protein D9613_011013 [Agrocybe pediades]|uniref:F-box domain-containing protein n=1 Tax=Agrocybe pediades TaxID=84607 RepID=A0A8H4QN00_9AGAR|nr:hypothetical protein D9613_011013 [Agrocybe pediades]